MNSVDKFRVRIMSEIAEVSSFKNHGMPMRAVLGTTQETLLMKRKFLR